MKVKISITGMHCDSCISSVQDALKSVPGLQSCSVEVGAAQVEYDENTARRSDVVAAIRSAGTFDVDRLETVN